jgi:hypothetical protein
MMFSSIYCRPETLALGLPSGLHVVEGGLPLLDPGAEAFSFKFAGFLFERSRAAGCPRSPERSRLLTLRKTKLAPMASRGC